MTSLVPYISYKFQLKKGNKSSRFINTFFLLKSIFIERKQLAGILKKLEQIYTLETQKQLLIWVNLMKNTFEAIVGRQPEEN